jgi:hypothetical protein
MASRENIPAVVTPLVYLSNGSGLGNRLRALLGYWAMSRCLGSPFYLCWLPNEACDAEFHDLFAPPPFPVIDLGVLRKMASRQKVHVYSANPWCDVIWRSQASPSVDWDRFMAAVRQCRRELRFQRPMVAAAERYSAARDCPARIGIHIRHTDNLAKYRDWSVRSAGRFSPRLVSSPAGFFREMDRLVRRHRLFVSTDSAGMAREVRRRYGDRVAFYPKRFRRLPRSSRPRRSTTVKAAVTEMLLLGKCRTIVGTYYSSFSKMSAILGQRPYREIQGNRSVANPRFTTGTGLLRVTSFHDRRDRRASANRAAIR